MKNIILIFLVLPLLFTACNKDKDEMFTITASTEGGGDISPVGEKRVPGGMNITYTFTPISSFVIDEVLVDGVNVPKAVTNGRFTFTNVFANHTITARFVQKFTITASARGGKISPEGTQALSGGESITFTFTPDKPEDVLLEVLIDGINNPNAVASGSYTFTNVEANHTIEARFKVLPTEFAVINGVKWALRNVDEPWTFAYSSDDGGKFYQWNRKVGWASTGAIIGWDSSMPSGDTWEIENDPSPAGYRIPTAAELQSLLEANKVTREWITQNGVPGLKFTDKESDNSIFMPCRGYRMDTTGEIAPDMNKFAGYWSSVKQDGANAIRLLVSDNPNVAPRGLKFGYNIRPVVDE